MIKLNNKNITYVALADSSNSLKAPKEIWYADSSNSVKLVYRRKDALIEGEDYEKYHWLEGRNGAYIDTQQGIKAFDDKFEVHYHYDGNIKNPDNGVQDVFGYASQDDNDWIRHYITSSNYAASNYFKQAGDWYHSGIITNDATIELWADASSFYYKVNGNSFTFSTNGLNAGKYPNCYVFACNGLKQTYSNRYFHGDIAYFKITDSSSTKMNLIPCKLLKPVPKWLDANGIRRQVGECGMIDLVSGKFYGNVNSVGTFTVENYYERKEWLVGDGSAYIQGIKYDLWNNHLQMRIGKVREELSSIYYINYYDSVSKSYLIVRLTYYAIVENNILNVIFRENATSGHIANISPYSSMNEYVDFDFYINNTEPTCERDGVIFTNSSTNVATQSNWTSIQPQIHSAKMSYIREVLPNGSYRSNLIPCTLTMDLPASMDANNIARTKGTSGMWDLVSDRFYGNVASSGTFKAVNLAEGVDYEVHQWLCGRNGAYIDTNYIPLHSDSISCHYRYDGVMRNPDGTEQEVFGIYNNVVSDGIIYRCRAYINSFNRLAVQFCLITDDFYETGEHITNADITDLHIEGGNFYFCVNGVQFSFPTNLDGDTMVLNKSLWIFGYNTGGTINKSYFHGDIAYFRITDPTFSIDRVNMTPCRLLRSIPAKYDANGIARQAGECGMYDTVNDVFYGNVASSGTFSVSDDS